VLLYLARGSRTINISKEWIETIQFSNQLFIYIKCDANVNFICKFYDYITEIIPMLYISDCFGKKSFLNMRKALFCYIAFYRFKQHSEKRSECNISISEYHRLPPITISSKIEPKMQNSFFKITLESLFLRILPFSVDNGKCNILIRWTCMKAKNDIIGR